MTRSDPKQVALLAVVAVGAFGFLAYNLVGLGRGVAEKIGGETPEEAKGARESSFETDLRSDPFTHPFLVEKNKNAQAFAASQTQAQKAMPPPSVTGSTADWSGPLPGPGFAPIQPQVEPTAPKQPAENTGTNREKEGKSLTSFRLSAVVNVEQSVAFMSVGGKDSQAFREGDLLAPGWRLLKIESGSVTVGSAGRRERVRVGQEVSL